jgi:RNA polymerase sigma-70 factor (TIGR02957 family)
MPDLTAFQSQRQRLFSIAYRMLGSATEAEDVLQDAWLRLAGADSADIHSREAFSTTVVTRLCLDRLKSARARRETYVGPWLPEPVLTSGAAPDVLAERSESVTLAFLVLLETLSPEERAVFLLKEVFEYEHLQIADMLGTTAANSRQLFHRAKSKIRRGPRHGVAPDRSTAERFALAFQNGDVDGLRSLLAADVGFVSDGGGKVSAARRPISGGDQVANVLAGFRRSAVTQGLAARASLSIAEVNAEAAVVVRVDGRVESVFVLAVEGEIITGIRVVRNPDKLAYIARQLGADA